MSVSDYAAETLRKLASQDSSLPTPQKGVLRTPAPSGATKHDFAKPRQTLIPQEVLDEIIFVLEEGAQRYGRDNWRRGLPYSRVIDAAYRHIAAIRRGELFSDHQVPVAPGVTREGYHAAHAIVELMFLLQFQLEGREELNDLRPNHSGALRAPTDSVIGLAE